MCSHIIYDCQLNVAIVECLSVVLRTVVSDDVSHQYNPSEGLVERCDIFYDSLTRV